MVARTGIFLFLCFLQAFPSQADTASKIISAIHVDNPRRSLEYFFGILKRLQQ